MLLATEAGLKDIASANTGKGDLADDLLLCFGGMFNFGYSRGVDGGETAAEPGVDPGE